jgi:hypothetical protein
MNLMGAWRHQRLCHSDVPTGSHQQREMSLETFLEKQNHNNFKNTKNTYTSAREATGLQICPLHSVQKFLSQTKQMVFFATVYWSNGVRNPSAPGNVKSDTVCVCVCVL